MQPVLVVDCYVEGDGSEDAFQRLLVGRSMAVWRALHEPRPTRCAAVFGHHHLRICSLCDRAGAMDGWSDRLNPRCIRLWSAGPRRLFWTPDGRVCPFWCEHGAKVCNTRIGWTDISVTGDDPLLAGLSEASTLLSHTLMRWCPLRYDGVCIVWLVCCSGISCDG